MGYFRVLAIDLDGTLTSDGRLSREALGGIARARSRGLTVLLVTGRIRSELEAEYRDIGDHFDAMVLENGAVEVRGGASRLLVPPVDEALTDLLQRRDVPFRRGAVLVAVDATHLAAVAQAIADLELDHQVVRNRSAAMVLPAGVTKGTGLLAVLGQLGLSCHNAVAVGDAENDLAMLEVAEVGAVVANALGSLRRRADLVLDGEGGAGVAALVDGPLLSGTGRLCPPRRWVRIGSFEGDSPVTVPGSQAKLLVTGPTGSGKSYLVGLLAEEWILAGYTVLVVDPEGDHVGLARLTNVHVVDASLHLPPPVDLLDLMVNPFSSVVLDLSGLDERHKASYVQRLPSVVEAQRAAHGVPHWVVIDEAHLPDVAPIEGSGGPWAPGLGYCLSSYMPDTLSERSLESVDVILTVQEAGPVGTPGMRRAEIRAGAEPARSFTVAPRRTRHVRHEHKYGDKPLPPERRFYFHSPQGGMTVASTLREFRSSLRHCDPGVLEFHALRGDLSRWINGTIADRELGRAVAALEAELQARRAADLERLRGRITGAIVDRYLSDDRVE